MNTLEKTLVYVALGLSILALVLVFTNSSQTQYGTSTSAVNCNGRAYCTAWVDILFRNGSSTDKLDVSSITTASTTRIAKLTVTDANATIPAITDSATTSTQTLTASQVCDNTILSTGFVTATGTLTLPDQPNVYCLSSYGDVYRFGIYASTTGQFGFKAGASSSLNYLEVSTSTSGVWTATTTVPSYGIAEVTGRLVATSTGSPTPKWIIWTIQFFK